MKKLLFLVAAAVAAGVSLAIPEPGLKQYALSGFSSGKYLTPDNWTDFKPSDPVVMPGALMAQEASINGRTWEGTKYPFANGNGYWYEGYMKLEAGKTYSGFSRFDDGGCIYIDGQLVYNQGTTSGHNSNPSFTPQPFVCTKSGWYKLQLGMWDWAGGRGLREDSIAIVQWSDINPADIKDNTRTYWNEFWDADADGKALGTYLYTEIPAQCNCELTRLSETSYTINAVYSGAQGSVKAVAKDSSGNRIETSAVTLDEGDQTVFTLSELAADTAYDLILEIDLNGTTLSQKIGSVFTGTVSITAGEDADEASGGVGTFTVALSGGAMAASDMEILYEVSDESTAIAGQTYVALPGRVVIPSGANAATIRVLPQNDKSTTEDTTVRLDLVGSEAYAVSEGAASATIMIKDGEFSGWLYNAELGQISCDGWVFAATLSGTSLTIGAVQSDPGEGATLDFSKTINGGYTIVTLNPNFAAYARKANLAKLILPEEGLLTISASAFKDCSSLVEISPYIPDSVTTLGDGAFRAVPAQQDLRLASVVNVPTSAFYASGVTKVYFGPVFKSVAGGWGCGAFANCSQLTEIKFDEAVTGAAFSGSERMFDACTSLTGVIDLSGFKSVLIGTNGTGNPFNGCTKISGFIFGEGLEKIGCNAFNGLTGLRTITFKGKPPKFYTTTSAEGTGNLFGNIGDSIGIETFIPEEYKDEWAVYAKGGVVNTTTSCWATPWTSSASQAFRPLVYKGSGGGGELGDWVIDLGTGILSRGDWKFNARKVGGGVIVETCIAAPAEVSTLDFTGSVTDADGNPLAIVSLDTKFNTTTDFRAKIGELVLNDGLSAINGNAFNGCSALTNVVNFLPDSVETIGQSIFSGCNMLKQTLFIEGVSTVPGSAFQATAITNVVFGSKLKSIEGAAFYNCKELRTLTFDPEMSGCGFGSGESHFNNCSLLGADGPLDLRGFSSVYIDWGGFKSPFRQCPKIGEVWLGEGLSKINGAAFNDMSGLSNVVFYGAPPATFATIQSGNKFVPFLANYDRVITTQVFKKYRKEWAPYTAGGTVMHKGSTWKQDYVSDAIDLTKRPLIGADFVDGLMLIVK